MKVYCQTFFHKNLSSVLNFNLNLILFLGQYQQMSHSLKKPAYSLSHLLTNGREEGPSSHQTDRRSTFTRDNNPTLKQDLNRRNRHAKKIQH